MRMPDIPIGGFPATSKLGRSRLVIAIKIEATMETPEFPKMTATDMTLVLGAESYIAHHRHVYNDPWGKQCLQDFVDLILNSERMHFTLPGKKNKGVPALIKELNRGGLLHKLPDAAIYLTPETEANIFDGFVNLVMRESETWLADWLAFQLINPIVTDGHRIRVGSMKPEQERQTPADSMISSDGYEIWKSKFSKTHEIELLRRVPPLKLRRYLTNYFERTKYKFSSDKEFFLCYAFDVYRRGWQYMSRVSAVDVRAAYFPHKIRNDALEASTDKWRTFRQNQKLLWSWGEYIVKLLDEYRIERSPERVAERIIRIYEAMRETKCPKWFNIGTIEDGDPFRDLIQQTIEKTTKKAQLPVLRIHEDPQTVELIETTVGIAFDFVAGPLLSAARGVRVIVKTVNPEFIGKLEVSIEDRRRTIINSFHKGTFGYPGLVVGSGNP